MSLIDLYVKDRTTGEIHKVGEDQHDTIFVRNGKLFYQNLQNGDGCVLTDEGCVGGYEFVDNADKYGHNIDPREKSQ